ncbi:hypothetical protein PCH_Pc12g00520 [Penicillium rubens Wisconsin 54-1255]|uniref:Uncharacterized protein n=1 Tax=Penicillium rubens (strain ATCC 28089 / DSM 1075 / NRRL 1951 / Wisconsin 54-1255) TaxID=500485 RepID=B6GXJ7_PENRW|nr:hypothetical protein PCH_Pc12g00520 [Penicillium rubens Wisconsin 54-1255]
MEGATTLQLRKPETFKYGIQPCTCSWYTCPYVPRYEGPSTRYYPGSNNTRGLVPRGLGSGQMMAGTLWLTGRQRGILWPKYSVGTGMVLWPPVLGMEMEFFLWFAATSELPQPWSLGRQTSPIGRTGKVPPSTPTISFLQYNLHKVRGFNRRGGRSATVDPSLITKAPQGPIMLIVITALIHSHLILDVYLPSLCPISSRKDTPSRHPRAEIDRLLYGYPPQDGYQQPYPPQGQYGPQMGPGGYYPPQQQQMQAQPAEPEKKDRGCLMGW